MLAFAFLAARGRRWAMVTWLAFSAHIVVSALAAVFALTFKMTRLF